MRWVPRGERADAGIEAKGKTMPEPRDTFLARGIDGALSAVVRAGEVFRLTYPAWETIPDEYHSWSAAEKLDFLWHKRVWETRYENLPSLGGLDWQRLVYGLRAVVRLGLTFEHAAEELPRNRPKVIHTFGTVCRVRFAAGASRYTGIFRGAQGLARLSLAGDPEMIGFTPGIALKFPLSGCRQPSSVNIVAMNSVNGQGGDRNWFGRPFSNLIPEARGLALKAGELLFKTVKRDPTFLPLEHLANWVQSGEQVAQPVSPHHIVLEAGDAVANLIPSNSTADFRDDLARIPAGTAIYRVYAADGLDAARQLIGELVTETRMVASWWGDKRLFFQHIM